MAIGIVTDRRDTYNEGIAHLQTGDTNGRLRRAIYHDYAPDYNFAQWQESGRQDTVDVCRIDGNYLSVGMEPGRRFLCL